MIYARLLATWFRKNGLRIPQDMPQSGIGIGVIEGSTSQLDIHNGVAGLAELGSEVIDFLLLDPGTEKQRTVLLVDG